MIKYDLDISSAVPSLELEHQIMNSNIPKNDREWWAAREIERLRKLAKELSNALLKIRPLGGSELYRRVGEDFYADADYCGRLIDEQRTALHEARLENVFLKRVIDPIKKQVGEIDDWIEREFGGYGVAIRGRDDPPIPGEPFISMVAAKYLVRLALAEFTPRT